VIRRSRSVRWLSLVALTLTVFGLATGVDAAPPETGPSTTGPSTTAPVGSGPAATGSSTTGPSVALDRTDVKPGEHVVLALNGFTTRSVTISVCGNEDRRGSSDCNMAASQSVELQQDGIPTVAEIPVAAPPVPCPCLIRVSSRLNDEVAIAPFTLTGHPVAPVVGGPDLDDPLVAVTITAHAAPHGPLDWIKANLGGSVPYQVTVTVKNITTEPLNHVTVFGSAGRNADDQMVVLTFDDPGEILPGQTWKQVVPASIPAPSLSKVQWTVVASRAGPWVTATVTTRHRPVLLLSLSMLFVLDISFLLIRRRMRRRMAREALIDDDAADVDLLDGNQAPSDDDDRTLVTTSS
jgi:hypothetical protein